LLRAGSAILLAALAVALPAPATASVREGLAFGAASGRVLRLDLHRSARTPDRDARAIVWIHGGGFYEGSRAEISSYAAEFARRGFVSLTVDYRLHTRAFLRRGGYRRALADAQHDVQAAVRWVRRHASSLGVDEARIYAGGFSAGAVTALRVGERPNDPGHSGNPGFSSRVAGSVSVAGGGDRASIGPGDAPALLLHGTRDGLVSYRWALDTRTAYRRAGVPCTLVTYPGVGHELGVLSLERRVFPAIARWLSRR
jgi:acetyl esterase/lipase